MALPADGQNANGLTKVTQIPAGKELMFIDPTTNEGGIITLEDLTKQILNGLTSQTFALDAGQKTIIQALNTLNSETSKLKQLYCIKKVNTTSSGTLIFTYNALRCSIIMFITQNQKDSSLYYIGINSSNNATITKIAGANCDIGVDISKKNIYVALPDWSSATLLSPDIA